MSPPRVFIAGATGYTGRAVVRCCATAGAETVAHVRPDSPRLEEWRRRFAEVGARVDATPWQPVALATTLAQLRPTHVFALLGTTRARARQAARADRPPADYEAVDYGLTRMLLDAVLTAEQAVGIRPRFVYLSAVGAREDTRNAYLRVRGRVERELQASGLPWLVARPSFITGADRDETRTMERATATVVDALLRPLALLGAHRLRDRYASITGDALGCSLARLALAERGAGRVVGTEELRAPAT